MKSILQQTIYALAIIAAHGSLFLEPSCASESGVELAREVRGILSEKCYHCHGPDANTREADLRLDHRDDLFDERNGTPIVLPGSLDGSELFARISSDDPDLRMPPESSKLALDARQIATIRKWIESGAEWTGHWAYQPIVRPGVPYDAAYHFDTAPQFDTAYHFDTAPQFVTANTLDGYEGPKNAIDWFVLSKLNRFGLAPSRPADKRRLLRRVSLDLTGVPPTADEMNWFLADETVNAYDRAVDRLIASPRYGERMVWEWLDAARYADSSGFQGDPERTMWPWRDWVVNALNANMPFDQFTIEQLAGDLLPNASKSQRIATGFNRNHMHNGEGGRIAEETRVENVFDRIETTTTVWMGLTFTCARCHDHKYDPLTQREYYELSAFFNNTTENGGGRGGQNAPVVEYRSREDMKAIAAAERRLQQESAGLDKLEANHSHRLRDNESLPDAIRDTLRVASKDRDLSSLDELVKYFDEITPRTDDVETYTARLESQRQSREQLDSLMGQLPKVMVMDERDEVRDTFVLVRGLYNKPSDVVGTDFPEALPTFRLTWSSSGDANRLALAEWLVDPSHPLTSRVTVNRIWQSFFGRGIVPTTENFGVQGEKPSNPELLDWLAAEFIESGWDVKRLHRLIVTSATYRQSSQVDRATLEADPRNTYLARGPRFRMPSWMLRDQALAIAGLLVDTIGGPSVKPYQPAGIWAEATFGKKKYEQDSGTGLYRRSMYTFWRRIVGPPMFFDAAKRQTCEVKRSLTNTPLHALSTLNDATYIEAARALAERVLLASQRDTDRIAMAFCVVTSRPPDKEELETLIDRYERLVAEFGDDTMAARDLLAVGASIRDEALDVSEHAAMATVCLLLLNLDETLTKE